MCEQSQAIELARLYVRQEFLAQKIGATLMQKALDEARARGYDTIFLGVWEHNERAKTSIINGASRGWASMFFKWATIRN